MDEGPRRDDRLDAARANEDAIAFGRRVGVGCFAAFIGVPSGAMIGVLIGKIVGTAQKCVPPEGLPACNWWWYALGGAIVGVTTLPLLVLMRLRRGSSAAR